MRVIILMVLIGAAFAVPQNSHRITGGSPTTIEQYPFMANMMYARTGTLFGQSCGGSLITTTSVLSAAHCFSGTGPHQWRVALGSSSRYGGGSQHEINRIIIHEQYDNPYFDSDVAIVKLATRALLSESVGIAKIAGANYNLPDGAVFTTIGWGRLTPSGTVPDQLHHVDINQINQELCAERYAYLKTLFGYFDWPLVTDNMICAGIPEVGGKDACIGDSGGPLIHAGDVVVGITSWGYRCGDDFYPGVNARVSKYADWIVDNGSN